MNAGATTEVAAPENGARGEEQVFLTAPKDLQRGAAYEAVLERLYARHGADRVLADRDLFEGTKDWKARWKRVYGGAGRLYVLVRPDGTVGLGIWKQTRWLQKRGVPTVVIPEDGQGVEQEGAVFERLGRQDGDGEEDTVRFARLSTEEPGGERAGTGTEPGGP